MASDRMHLVSLVKSIATIRQNVNADIAISHLHVFLYVALNEGCSSPDIIKSLQMSQSAVARACRQLSKYSETGKINGYDLVYQTPDAYERRRLAIYLTPKGKKLKKAILESISGSLAYYDDKQKVEKTTKNSNSSTSADPVFSEEKCDKCSAPMLIDKRRGKDLLRCSAYPACINIVTLPALKKRKVDAKKIKVGVSVSQKEAFGDDHVICLICGKEMKTLTRHIKAAHNLKPGQYRKKFGISASQALSAKTLSENSRKKAIDRGQSDKLAAARAAKAKAKPVETSKENVIRNVSVTSRFVKPKVDVVNVFDDIKI